MFSVKTAVSNLPKMFSVDDSNLLGFSYRSNAICKDCRVVHSAIQALQRHLACCNTVRVVFPTCQVGIGIFEQVLHCYTQQ